MGDSVEVFFPTDLKRVATIPLGKGAGGIVFTPDGKRCFVANTDDNSVSSVDPGDIPRTGAHPRWQKSGPHGRLGMDAMKPEIMSPAGYWPQLHAAIEAGADAVYFGLKHFSARAKVGFALEELPEVDAHTASARRARLLTFNTLIFEHELEAAAKTAAAIVEAGADALIVQDLGMLRLLRQHRAHRRRTARQHADEHHAMPRACVSRRAAARTALRWRANCRWTKCAPSASKPAATLEMFVHGALCVAYSGQCFSSEAWGGRSANRGQCAQACRLPYELIVDGEPEPLGDARYLLSPGDLYTLEQIPADRRDPASPRSRSKAVTRMPNMSR